MWENLSLKEVAGYAKDPYPSITGVEEDHGEACHRKHHRGRAGRGNLRLRVSSRGAPGHSKPLKKAPSLLPDNACSLARSNLELALSYEGDLFDGFVLPQVCDTTQHLSDIWRINFPDMYTECFLAPRQRDRASARYWVKEEIERLIASLSKRFGRTVSERDLKDSFALHNRNKELLKDIYEIKRRYPGSITNKELFCLIKLSMQVDKAELNRSIERIRDSLPRAGAGDTTDVVLAGITCDPPEIFDLFDEIGLNVVADTLVTGSRYLQGIIPEDLDPVDALGERHFMRGFYSPIHDGVYRGFIGAEGPLRPI